MGLGSGSGLGLGLGKRMGLGLRFGFGFGFGFGLGLGFGFGAFFGSVRLPRCHLPLMPVTYPSGLTCSAMVITWGGSVLGPYPQSSPFLQSPKLFWFLPLSNPAREGEH